LLNQNASLPSQDQIADLGDPHHTSGVLRVFTEQIEKVQDAQVLDLGPVCTENISFFAKRVKRLFVCDMFIRLDSAHRSGLPLRQVWKHLDYPSRNFDGIMLWDLIDYLDNDEAHYLLDLCHTMLKPAGMLLAVVQNQCAVTSKTNSYAVVGDFGVCLRPQPHLRLLWRKRHNRALLDIAAPFTPIKWYIYRDGIREILLKRG